MSCMLYGTIARADGMSPELTAAMNRPLATG